MPVEWLIWLSACLVTAIVWRWSWLTHKSDSRLFVDITGAGLITLAWHPNVWTRISLGYTGDSIYTLSIAGAAGLVVLTSSLMLLLIALSVYKSRRLQSVHPARSTGAFSMLTLDLLLTVLLFVIGLTIVPQLHYTYYHLLFDLPRQWVIKPLPFTEIWNILRVPSDANLATHASGLFGWWLLVLLVLNWLRFMHLASPAWLAVWIALLAKLSWHFISESH